MNFVVVLGSYLVKMQKLSLHKNETGKDLTIFVLIHTFVSGKLSRENVKLRFVYKFAKDCCTLLGRDR